MSSSFVFFVLVVLVHSARCTIFPPVSNPPPIPGQAVRTLDISGQRFYVQDDLQVNPPQTVIKEEGFYSYPSEPKPDDQWFVSENDSATGDFPTSSEAFERLYANGLPAIGPVATPPPDDNYVAQPSGTSKVFPDNPGSGVWVLAREPNDQFVPERWMQVQVPAERVVEVVNTEGSSKVVSETVKSSPQTLFPVKSQSSSVPPNVIQQVWVRVPSSVALQKGFPNTASLVKDVPSIKQIVDVPPSDVKQSFQPQIVKDFQPPPPPPPPPTPVLVKKSSGFAVPPPPPPPLKSIDASNAKQTVVFDQPVASVVDKGSSVVGKSAAVQQMKHIWVPTSPQTGKFITMPVGSAVNVGQPILSKGTPLNSGAPVSISDTWVLKQDGLVPRFEQQKSQFPDQVVQKTSFVVDETPVVQFDSPKNAPVISKSVDAPISSNIWPQRNDVFNGKTLQKVQSAQPVFPLPPGKTDSIVVEKSIQTPAVPAQKTYSYGKYIQPQPPVIAPQPPVIATPAAVPAATLVKGKPPCPTTLQKSPFPPNVLSYPGYRSVANIKRQPITRIIRVNRYPFGSYYILNPAVRPNAYAYPRQAVTVQNVNNRVVRLVSSRQLPFPFQQRQVAISAPVRQVALPVASGKSVPRFFYPPVQAVSKLRYALPWSGYLTALPAVERNVAAPAKKSRKTKKESSSSSSSSESSESKAESAASEGKESEESTESVGSSESVEPETEKGAETEPTEPVVSEVESEAEVEPAESESKESIEAAESQFIHKVSPRSFLDSSNENLKSLGSPVIIDYNQHNTAGTNQQRKEINDLDGRIIGSYGYKNGIVHNAYVSNAGRYRSEFLSNAPEIVHHKIANSNFINAPLPASTTKPELENVTESPPHVNLAFDYQRD